MDAKLVEVKEPREGFVNVKGLKKRYPSQAASWWYSKAESGQIPSYKLGKYRLFKISEIEAWIQGQRQGPR